LSTDMLDQPHGLLPWIATNEGVYLGLWWICLASLLCLLPVMPTLYWSTPATGSAIALVGAIAGLAGVVIGIVGGDERGERVRAGIGVPGGGRRSARSVGGAQRAFRGPATVLRMFSDVLVGLRLLATGLAWMETVLRGGGLEAARL
jgi:hypothetical protein